MEKELISSREYEIVEVCPHCDSEIVMQWSVEYLGYKAFCPVCGGRLMLCDECFHADDNPGQYCDWSRETDTCFRRKKEEVK